MGRLLLTITLSHILAAVFIAMMSPVTPAMLLALTVSYVYSALPIFFLSVKISELSSFNHSHNLSLIVFLLVISLPPMILLLDRISYGFEISINPVLMRDQMLARQLTSYNDTLAKLGNALQIPALMAIFHYAFFEKSTKVRSLLVLGYFAFFIWIAGSRAFLLGLVVLFWVFRGAQKPNRRDVLFLILFVFFFILIFLLRSERSDINMTSYIGIIFQHLQIPLSEIGTEIISSFWGIIALSIGYIFHSIYFLAEVMQTPFGPGSAFTPINAIISRFVSYASQPYVFDGYFITAAGIILYDFGWPGYVISIFLKSVVFLYSGKFKNSIFFKSFTLILLTDCVLGIWTSVMGILLIAVCCFSILLISIWKDIYENLIR